MFLAKEGKNVVLIGLGLLGCLGPEARAQVEARSYQTHSHLAFAVDPSVDYRVDRIRASGQVIGLRLTLERVVGEAPKLQGFSDLRTAEVIVASGPVREDGSRAVSYEVRFTSKGREQGVEYFDYRNKVPATIALDYWFANAPAAHPEEKTASRNGPKNRGAIAKAKPQLRPNFKSLARAQNASPTGCGEPLRVGKDPFVYFRTYHVPYDYKSFFALGPADSGYEYPLLKTGNRLEGHELKNAEELAHYRLAHKLYKDGKFALTLRTIEFFEQQYAASLLAPELRFLRASALVRLSDMLRTEHYLSQALEIYRRIILEEPESKRGKLALRFFVQELMRLRPNAIETLEHSLLGAEQPALDKGDLSPIVFRLASAESLQGLGEYDRAERAYQKIIDDESRLSPEAAFRIGEVYSARKQWERAIFYFERAIKQFAAETSRFPSAYFNLAEAYFRLGNYAESEKRFEEYVRRFGHDSLAWGARLRLAELFQMKKLDSSSRSREQIVARYEDVINQVPYSPGAVFSELRISTCLGDGPASERETTFFTQFFSERDLKRLENEWIDASDSELWFDFAEAKYRTDRHEYAKALAKAPVYRQKLGALEFGESFRKIFANASRGLIEQLVDSGKYTDAAAAADEYSDLLPNPVPVSLLYRLAKGQQELGFIEESARRVKELEARLAEFSPEEKDGFFLVKARNKKLAGFPPEQVIAELVGIRDEGPFAIEKYDELSEMALRKDDFRSTFAYDTRLLETDLGRKLTPERRLAIAVRRLEACSRISEPSETARLSSHALLQYGTLTQEFELISKIKNIHARALYDSGRFKEAIAAIDEVLSDAPEHPRKNEFEFMRGKGLAKLGRESEAFDTFRKLARASSEDVWKKSAQAELDQLQWESNISKQRNNEKDRRSSQ